MWFACNSRKAAGIAMPMLLLAACAQTPMGPTVAIMPGPGKSFDVFQGDQAGCKTYAAGQVQDQAQNANNRAVGAAALTTVLGAGLGAAIGGGRGAGIGAASGALGGTGIGAATSSDAQRGIQLQYDNSFAQCMYAKGHSVPGYAPIGGMARVPSSGGPDPALVRSVQGELVRLSYLRDTPDGVFGARTSAAIRDFERANGMSASGTVSSGLLARLQATPTSAGGTSGPSGSPPGWAMPGSKPPVADPSAAPVSSPSGVPSEWVAPATRSP